MLPDTNVLSWAGRQALKMFLSNFKKYLEILCCYLDNIEKKTYTYVQRKKI